MSQQKEKKKKEVKDSGVRIAIYRRPRNEEKKENVTQRILASGIIFLG